MLEAAPASPMQGEAEPVAVFRRLLVTAKTLYANSQGCAVNHYGHDYEIHGEPLPPLSSRERSDMAKLPLNGTKTHPLSDHARGVLLTLSVKPLSSYTINPGVRDRLSREDLAEEFIDRRGSRCYRITAAGRAALAGEE